MPFATAACVKCRVIREWWIPGRQRWPLLPDCVKCGEPLERPGTRGYELVMFEGLARTLASKIRLNAIAPKYLVPTIEANRREEAWDDARDLAHQARRLFHELRFEFDTDASGRPLN